MNCILLQTADYSQALDIVTDDLPAIDDAFATTPMRSIPPAFYAQHEEEEIYTSFEEAISDRVLAMQRQTQQLGPGHGQRPVTGRRQVIGRRQASPLPSPNGPHSELIEGRGDACLRPVTSTFNPVILTALGLALILLGFDLMGLLVLFAH